MTKKVNNNQMTNWYEKIPDVLRPKYKNPNYKNHLLNLMFRMVIVGASGSGKTTLLLELISRMPGTWSKIILCLKSRHEPLYEYLASKIDEDILEIYEGIQNIPNPENYKDLDDQILIVFDDLVIEKNQENIIDYFIRGRKIAGGMSMIYLTQSYYKTPKIIRIQCNYIILKKLSSKRDLKMILSESDVIDNIDELTQYYICATKEKSDFLLIDIDGNELRHNFLNIVYKL